MRGKFADAKVEEQQLQLGGEGQRRLPDVLRAAAPQLHRAARPAVLLLAVCEEAGGELRTCTPAVSTSPSRLAGQPGVLSMQPADCCVWQPTPALAAILSESCLAMPGQTAQLPEGP